MARGVNPEKVSGLPFDNFSTTRKTVFVVASGHILLTWPDGRLKFISRTSGRSIAGVARTRGIGQGTRLFPLLEGRVQNLVTNPIECPLIDTRSQLRFGEHRPKIEIYSHSKAAGEPRFQ